MRKRLLNNAFKMAEGYSRDYNRKEKRFVESLYDSRVFQKAKDNGKVLCPDCNVSQRKVQLFTISGIEFHYRRIHKGKKFDHDMSVELFHSFHDLRQTEKAQTN